MKERNMIFTQRPQFFVLLPSEKRPQFTQFSHTMTNLANFERVHTLAREALALFYPPL